MRGRSGPVPAAHIPLDSLSKRGALLYHHGVLTDTRVSRPLALGVVSVLAAGMGLVWVLGGLEEAPAEGLTPVEPGQEIDQGIYTAKVVRAYESHRIEPGDKMAEARGVTEPQRVIGLEMRVENLDTNVADPTDYIGEAGREDGEKVLIPRMKVRAGDDTYLQFLELHVRRPDRPSEFYLPARVDVGFRTGWMIPADKEPPDEITVELTNYEPRGVDFYDIPDYWLPEVEEEPGGPLDGPDQSRPRMVYQVETPVEEDR